MQEGEVVRSRSESLEFALLGLLSQNSLHGYELRKRLTAIYGPFRALSFSVLYPQLKRMMLAGLIEESTEAATDVDGGGSEPVGIVAQYTATGATIFWKAPADGTEAANYNVEIRSNGGDWKLISTVPATQFSLDITKGDATGWCSFRVSTVLEDGTVVGGKVFGLPGQYA